MTENSCRALITTPLSLEMDAVLAHLSDQSIEEIEHSTGKVYLKGRSRSGISRPGGLSGRWRGTPIRCTRWRSILKAGWYRDLVTGPSRSGISRWADILISSGTNRTYHAWLSPRNIATWSAEILRVMYGSSNGLGSPHKVLENDFLQNSQDF